MLSDLKIAMETMSVSEVATHNKEEVAEAVPI
jgi:hypothetical protein